MLWMLICKVEELPKTPEDAIRPSDTEVGDFYVRLGMAVAAWQFVESALVQIYANAIGTLNYKALTASFHIPTNFRARLDMADTALRHAELSADTLAEWDKLYERIRDKAARRNELAHGTVMFYPKRKPGHQLFLSPSVSDPTRFTDNTFAPGTIITKSELETMIDVFQKLRKNLHDFSLKLPPAIRPLPASFVPPA